MIRISCHTNDIDFYTLAMHHIILITQSASMHVIYQSNDIISSYFMAHSIFYANVVDPVLGQLSCYLEFRYWKHYDRYIFYQKAEENGLRMEPWYQD